MPKVIILFILLAIVFVGHKAFSSPASLDKKYELIVKTSDGTIFDLSKIETKPTIIIFWTSWCNICAKELNVINKNYKEEAKKFEIIAINYTPQDNDEDAKKFLQKLNPLFKTANFYDITKNNFPKIITLPTTYLISKDKKKIEEYTLYNSQ